MMKQTFYCLPPEQCERLNRHQMQALRWLIGVLHIVAVAPEDLGDRLDCIPNGRRRYRLMHGQLNAIVNDLIGTITLQQAKQINNTIHDMTMQMVPKGTPVSHKVVVETDDLARLIAYAQKEKCSACIATDDDARRCDLYKTLEAIAPRPDYGSGTMCPYMDESWMED